MIGLVTVIPVLFTCIDDASRGPKRRLHRRRPSSAGQQGVTA